MGVFNLRKSCRTLNFCRFSFALSTVSEPASLIYLELLGLMISDPLYLQP